MKYSKKAEFPMTKTILIILITITILITYMILLSNNRISIDEKKINTQILANQILNQNCFSNKFDTIQEDKFTQNNANSCFNKNNKILAKIILDTNNNKKSIYIGDENEFNIQSQFCNNKNNKLCTKLIYPITLKTKSKSTNSFITLFIITN